MNSQSTTACPEPEQANVKRANAGDVELNRNQPMTAATPPILDEPTRSFVQRCLSAGLVEINDIKKVVVSLQADGPTITAKRLAEGLIGAGLLTHWQANKLLAGKSKGFYLGSYRLLRPLGKGGMGVVYLGEHHVMKRLMALKIMPPDSVADKRRADRFREEARASAQLDHPNIVRAYDFAQAGGKLYIVMEYIDGIDLQHAVRRDGVMSVPLALDAIRQATCGLAHAHDRGIIHRDIKPSNLMLRTDGVVKVSDMGLARVSWMGIDEQSTGNRLLGTADFVAPEQAINSKNVDARADIYSLGCTLYYLLTGQAPFSGNTIAQRLAKHQTATPPDVRLIHPDCPTAVAELVMRMMAKRPEDRPKSAAELLVQFERLSGISGSVSAAAKKLGQIAPAGETVMDESFYQATIDDSSLSSDGAVPIASEVTEIDFDSLPPVDLGMTSGPPKPSAISTANGSGTANAKSNDTNTRSGDAKQMLLLGIGLTVAIAALLLVMGMTAYTIMRPQETPSPRIKSLEDGKGGHVIVVN